MATKKRVLDRPNLWAYLLLGLGVIAALWFLKGQILELVGLQQPDKTVIIHKEVPPQSRSGQSKPGSSSGHQRTGGTTQETKPSSTGNSQAPSSAPSGSTPAPSGSPSTTTAPPTPSTSGQGGGSNGTNGGGGGGSPTPPQTTPGSSGNDNPPQQQPGPLCQNVPATCSLVPPVNVGVGDVNVHLP